MVLVAVCIVVILLDAEDCSCTHYYRNCVDLIQQYGPDINLFLMVNGVVDPKMKIC